MLYHTDVTWTAGPIAELVRLKRIMGIVASELQFFQYSDKAKLGTRATVP